MASPFPQTLHSLETDHGRWALAGVVTAVILLGAWFTWFIVGRITVYRVTDHARIEAREAAHPIEPPVLGRVVKSNLILGQEVNAGDPLVVLDSEEQVHQKRQQQARLVTAYGQLAALADEERDETAGIGADLEASRDALGAAKAKERVAESLKQLDVQKSEKIAQLKDEKLLSAIDYLQHRTESEQRQADAAVQRFDSHRQAALSRSAALDRRKRVDQLRSEMARLRGEVAAATAQIESIDFEIERRTLRATVAGKIAEVAQVPVGSFVSQGQRVAAIVPSGDLRAVAEFLPSDAVGRVQPGEQVFLRLDGFPWTQYGVVEGVVTSVASETRAGMIRVEMRIKPNPRIPLEHGLTGTAEVKVEDIAPVMMVLRSVGQSVGRPVNYHAPAPSATAPVETPGR